MIEWQNSQPTRARFSALVRRAVAGDLVPGPGEARQALGVHLQQIARARPLKAPDLPRAARRGRARHAAPRQAAADRGVRHPELAGDQPRPPAGPLARLADAVMHRLADPAGLACGVDGRSSAHAPDAPLVARRPGGSDRSSTAPSTRSPVDSSPLRGETSPDQDTDSTSSTRCHPAATYACPASGLMTSEDRGSVRGPTASVSARMPHLQLTAFGTSRGTSASGWRRRSTGRRAAGDGAVARGRRCGAARREGR